MDKSKLQDNKPKECGRCGRNLPLSEYDKKPDGAFYALCKRCRGYDAIKYAGGIRKVANAVEKLTPREVSPSINIISGMPKGSKTGWKIAEAEHFLLGVDHYNKKGEPYKLEIVAKRYAPTKSVSGCAALVKEFKRVVEDKHNHFGGNVPTVREYFLGGRQYHVDKAVVLPKKNKGGKSA